MNKRLPLLIVWTAMTWTVSLTSWAQLHDDGFNTDTSGNYVPQFTPDNDDVQFAFDYGCAGNSGGPPFDEWGTGCAGCGPTIRRRSQAAQCRADCPHRTDVGLDYRATFDLWMNVNGRFRRVVPDRPRRSWRVWGLPRLGGLRIKSAQTGAPISRSPARAAWPPTYGRSRMMVSMRGINVGPSNDTSDLYYAELFPAESTSVRYPCKVGNG